MMGMNMIIQGLGLDPKKIMENVEKVSGDVHSATAELARQGALLNAIARKLGIDPDNPEGNSNGTGQLDTADARRVE